MRKERNSTRERMRRREIERENYNCCFFYNCVLKVSLQRNDVQFIAWETKVLLDDKKLT